MGGIGSKWCRVTLTRRSTCTRYTTPTMTRASSRRSGRWTLGEGCNSATHAIRRKALVEVEVAMLQIMTKTKGSKASRGICSSKDLNHEVVLNLRPIVPAPRRQLTALVGQNLAHHRRAAVEDADLKLLVPLLPFAGAAARAAHLGVPAPPALALPEFHHLFVVLVEDLVKVRPAEVRRVEQTCQGRSRVFLRAVHLEQPAVDVRDYALSLGRDVGVD